MGRRRKSAEALEVVSTSASSSSSSRNARNERSGARSIKLAKRTKRAKVAANEENVNSNGEEVDELEQIRSRQDHEEVVNFVRSMEADDDDDDDDDEEEGDSESREEQVSMPQVESMVEDDFNEVGMDVDENAAQSESDDEEDAADKCGVVVRIECTDFMCHKRMTVSLGPNVNFITGPNGSGKSAIIAALQICLGMRANSTHRGEKLSTLIRHGSTGNAIVSVTLSNRGFNAYKKSEYGSAIIVERTLRRVGGASYKLKNGDTKKTVSTRKADLDEIIDRFGLWVDNPCCVLDQENSKLFLRGNDKDKYVLFLKATKLQQIMKAYEEEEKKRDFEKRALKREKEKLPMFERAAKEAQDRLAELREVGDLNSRHRELEMDKVWAIVADVKASFEGYKTRVQEMEAKVEKAEAKAKEAEEKKCAQDGEKKRFKAEIEAAQKRFDESRKRIDVARDALDDAKQPVIEQNAACTWLRGSSRFRSKAESGARSEKSCQEAMSKRKQRVQEDQEDFAPRILALEEEISGLDELHSETREKLDAYEENLSNMDLEGRQIQRLLRDTERRKVDSQTNLRNARAAVQNKEAVRRSHTRAPGLD